MRKSISTWSFPGEWDLEKKFRLASEAGFEGFEVDLTEDGPINPHTSCEALTAIRQQAASFGLTLSGLATGLYWGANGASVDAGTRQRAAEILQAQLKAAHELGIDSILVIPASVGVDFIPGCEVVPYPLALERGRALIESALPTATELGVRILIENVWNKFLLSPVEFAAFIDQFDTPLVGAYFDVGNALATGYPEDWITILGPRIGRVHFKDYRRAIGTADGFVELLSGDVNWPAVTEALRSIGYEGWVAAEMIPPVPFYRYHPEVLIDNTARAMNRILQ